MNLSGKSTLQTEILGRARPRLGISGLLFLVLALLIIAFLIPYGLLQSCSPTTISLFLWLLGVSVLSGITGIIISAVYYKKHNNRLYLISLLLAVLYISLLLYLVQFMYY